MSIINFQKKYIAFITVRTSSNRLKNKCFLKINKYKVIEHCILRCFSGNIIPIVCTTNNVKDKKLVKIAKKYNIKFFCGSEKNKIKRWYDCAKKFKIIRFHTVDADDPYFDAEAVKKSLNILNKNFQIILPSILSRKGGASEGYSFTFKGIEMLFKSLFKYNFKKINLLDTEMIDKFLKNSNIGKKTFKGMRYQFNEKIRLTLDYKADYNLIKILSKNFSYSSKRKDINTYLKNNRKLLKINYFLNEKWKKKQKKFNLPELK
tara:strand:- start:769 stop:1554 length:786 start_codon:yes stop_codon:yes gene_type:complete